MKKFISSLIFLIIVLFLLIILNDVLMQKIDNRYYILEQDFSKKQNNFDILIFGSCHAYTSFNPTFLEKNYNMSSYVLANPGEIIPTTYARMKEQFKNYTPKYAIVEIWGINAYDTYDSTEKILGDYLQTNLEQLPLSFTKLEIIKDFNLNVIEMNCAASRYKDRILNQDLKDIDFNYSFEKALDYLGYFETEIEMTKRLANNGFKSNPSNDISSDYNNRISSFKSDNYLEIEPVLVKYLNKIIDLCKKHNVNLIFYRSPYLANDNELRKLNHLKQLCSQNDVPFIDLEKETQYDYSEDFSDIYHLSESGANKSTEYLANYILEKY